MKILAISIAPIFKDHVHGGSQRIFLDVMNHLSKKHEIRTYCTKRIDNYEPFKFNKNFEVYPLLPFRQFFPFPYMTNPKNLVDIIRIIENQSGWADCIYLHADGYLLKNFLSTKLPIVSSYHDFIYPITLSSALIGSSDKIILPSKYLFECFKSSVGYLFENILSRVEVINNGINEKIFFKDNSKTKELKEKLGIKQDEKVILFPHRPEVSKGINESIELLERLLKLGIKVKLLFPEYIDCKSDPEIRKDYILLKKSLSEKGILSKVSFFDWVSYTEMRHIYSLSDITLNLGNFVEAFGLVPLESLLCQTPVICTRAGSLRYNLLENLEGIDLIDYGQKEELFRRAKKLLDSPSISFIQVTHYIRKNFNYFEMLRKYEKLFEKVIKSPKLIKKKILINAETNYTLAPWCYIKDKSIYDDYFGDYVKTDEKLINLLKHKKNITLKEIGLENENLLELNIIIPKND